MLSPGSGSKSEFKSRSSSVSSPSSGSGGGWCWSTDTDGLCDKWITWNSEDYKPALESERFYAPHLKDHNFSKSAPDKYGDDVC